MTEHVPSVEERLRVCLTLAKGLYVLNELAAEHPYVQAESFAPDEVNHQLPQLTRALRDQLLAIRAALPFECKGRAARMPTVTPCVIAPLPSSINAPAIPDTQLLAEQALMRRLREGGKSRKPRKGGAR